MWLMNTARKKKSKGNCVSNDFLMIRFIYAFDLYIDNCLVIRLPLGVVLYFD